MSKLLLDTNFIVAAILPNDELHERAVELEMNENIVSSNECYVSNQIVTEVMNILGQKDSVEVAKNAYNMMKDNFIWINEYEIPDFTDKVEREKYANDYLSPFENTDSENYISSYAKK